MKPDWKDAPSYTDEDVAEAVKWAFAQAEMFKGIPKAGEPWMKIGAMLFDLQSTRIGLTRPSTTTLDGRVG